MPTPACSPGADCMSQLVHARLSQNRNEPVQLAWQGLRSKKTARCTLSLARAAAVLFQHHLPLRLPAGRRLLVPAQDEPSRFAATRSAMEKVDGLPPDLLLN